MALTRARGIAPAAQKFKIANLPRQFGERLRLRVTRGPDSGSVYVISGANAVIGRGDECHVVLADIKASRKHAELNFTQQGWAIADLGSANGIKLNAQTVDAKAGAKLLRSGDVVVVGDTQLELVIVEGAINAATSGAVLNALPSTVPSALSSSPKPKTSPSKTATAVKPKNKKNSLIILAFVLGGLFFLFEQDKPNRTINTQVGSITATNSQAPRNLASIGSEPKLGSKPAEVFFKLGFREFRQQNYLRARQQFETVLQIVPKHRLAMIYLENCNKQIEAEIKGHLEQGAKSKKAGLLSLSKGHFEAVLRLLYRDPTNPSYLEAKDQLDAVVEEMKPEYAADSPVGGG